jgi:raffinose/stachyose/melibiose transport system permease protein
VAPARKRRRRHRSPTRRAENRLAFFLLLPAVAIYGAFMLAPFAASIYYSLTDWDGVEKVKHFVGIDNFTAMLHDPRVSGALLHNLVFVVAGTLLTMSIGVLLAVLLWGQPAFGSFYRLVFFIPFTLPVIVVGIVWSWIYNPLFGSLNSGLGSVGLTSLEKGWLGDAGTALPSLVVAQTWALVGFVVVIVLAGLQNVDPDLVDASQIDGARWINRLKDVILPQIAPVITMVTALIISFGFQTFDIVFVTTNGGPGTSTEVLGTYAYHAAFRQNEVGYGTALSLVMTVLSIAAAVGFVGIRDRQHRHG